MKFFPGLVAGLMLMSAAQAQNPTSTSFRFWKPIDRDAAQAEEIVAFTLDSDVYDATRAGLSDLRVLDEAQAEAPYVIEPEFEFRQERSRQSFNSNIVTLRPDGNAIEVHLRLPDNSPEVEGFSFVTP